MTRLSPALGLAVLVVLAAGCVTLPGGESGPTPTAAELEAQVDDADPPSAATATVVSERGDTVAYTEEMWLRDDGATNTETTDGRFRNVNDGEWAWFYDVGADRVTVIDANRTPDSHFAYLYDTQRTYFDELDVAAIEEATIDGRDTYHVTFEPPRDETVDTDITVLVGDTEFVIPLETSEADESAEPVADRIDVWIDQETLFPIKQELEGEGIDRTWTYTDLSFGDDIDDERFTFEPPEDAVVAQNVHPYGRSVDSIAAAESETNLTVTEPTHLPAGLERDSIEVSPSLAGDTMTATLRYVADDRRTLLVSTTTTTRLPDGAGESVTVGGRSVTKVESQFGTQLAWTCGEQVVSIFASAEFDLETAFAVAESIECGAESN
ncbi:hypothetical protein [Natrinema sp. SYSU A 869]|uniref:LolA family protein n=1 Tax=Natrinema sp. SYSU A 869 TaxID=2871694 RepID=UPI001CA44B61|nr:hypothetical protein [Natrinema sp. SYSU A 869]